MSSSGRPIDPAPAVGPETASHAPVPPRAPVAAPLTREFLASLAAELNAGLHGVLALTELLERQPLGGDAPAYVRTLADCGRNLINILADALEVSAATAPPQMLPQPVRLRDLLDEVQAEWLPRAVEDGVALGAVFKGEAGLSAELDAEGVKSVYAALIGHALKLTRRGGVEAILQAEVSGERVRLLGQVRDTAAGPKPAPADLLTCFEPFDPRHPAARGAGLDLAVAQRRVERLGGRIWAEANAGLGSTILFELEVDACRAPGALPGQTLAPTAPVLSGHILIVDDNATNRMVARTLVELFGCTCELAEDGVEALAALDRAPFDAVLMDIRMPRLDGVAATRRIRALPAPACFTPVIALTANADPEDVKVYQAAGMAGVVDKPIKPDRLLHALSQALARDTVRVRTAA